MIKQTLISSATSAIIAIAIVLVMGGQNFAGLTHFSGLSVGSSGFEVTNSGAVDLGSGEITLTGTTTIAKSPDGFVAWDDYTVATGSKKMIYTNSGSDMMCDGSSGAVYANSTGYSPALSVSVGTSTSITSATMPTNLVSSTTISTTTDKVIPFTITHPFLLANGESIVGSLADVNANSSSTYFANWSIEMGVSCRTLGQ